MKGIITKNKTFYKMESILKGDTQSTGQFFISQIDRCVEAIQEAGKNASKGKDGKPIFYTSLKRKTRSGRTQGYSVHFLDETMGEMHSVNYIASILLDLRIDQQERFIIVRSAEHDDGQSIIEALSNWYKFGNDKSRDHFTHIAL